MKTNEFEALALQYVFIADVKVDDYVSVSGATLFTIDFTPQNIVISQQSLLSKTPLKTISYSEIEKVLFRIHRGADIGRRADRPVAHYIFDGRFTIFTKENKHYQFISRDVRSLKKIAEYLKNKVVILDDVMITKDKSKTIHVLALIDANYNAKEQYDCLNDQAHLFDKTDEDYYNEKRL